MSDLVDCTTHVYRFQYVSTKTMAADMRLNDSWHVHPNAEKTKRALGAMYSLDPIVTASELYAAFMICRLPPDISGRLFAAGTLGQVRFQPNDVADLLDVLVPGHDQAPM
ncbi:unnamed protein product [Kuraishia capsulata CBS 1993]|uniref:Uncharacterized protein n=1 Tax=Kuraishia capsulata CBS 1993 TaxID=1382522 RepID=W6MMC2_9ASCO|nr:uncharacterized protein KUCA_T00003665001 [Kuraishia capsulata CBS 1993]CDK27686.1 unnamed protein product [Kuraishia capsulata CBS 1993]